MSNWLNSESSNTSSPYKNDSQIIYFIVFVILCFIGMGTMFYFAYQSNLNDSAPSEEVATPHSTTETKIIGRPLLPSPTKITALGNRLPPPSNVPALQLPTQPIIDKDKLDQLASYYVEVCTWTKLIESISTSISNVNSYMDECDTKFYDIDDPRERESLRSSCINQNLAMLREFQQSKAETQLKVDKATLNAKLVTRTCPSYCQDFWDELPDKVPCQ